MLSSGTYFAEVAIISEVIRKTDNYPVPTISTDFTIVAEFS